MWASRSVGSPCFLTVLCRKALGKCCAAVDTGHSWGMWSWWCLLKTTCFPPYASQLAYGSCLLSEQLVPDLSLSLACLALSAFLFFIFTNDIFSWLLNFVAYIAILFCLKIKMWQLSFLLAFTLWSSQMWSCVYVCENSVLTLPSSGCLSRSVPLLHQDLPLPALLSSSLDLFVS